MATFRKDFTMKYKGLILMTAGVITTIVVFASGIIPESVTDKANAYGKDINLRLSTAETPVCSTCVKIENSREETGI